MPETVAKRKPPLLAILLGVILVVALGYVGVVAAMPARPVQPISKLLPFEPSTDVTAVTWPAYGQAAIGVATYGVVATNGTQASSPVGSIAKLFLAYSVLQEKPLKLGETGPSLTFTQADVDLYKKYLAQNGSVVPVQINESLTEYQTLQALLIPSGDNIADSLAIWAFGSVDNYLAYANKFASDKGLGKTHLADSSGLSAQTTSSAQDLVTFGSLVLQQPVLAQIVSQAKVTLPVAGPVTNYNRLLGKDNVIGIKTGNTDQAGGCFLFAYTKTIDEKNFTVIGAILGAPNLSSVIGDTDKFIQANGNAIEPVKALSVGQTAGSYLGPWKQSVTAVVRDEVWIYLTKNQSAKATASLDPISTAKSANTQIGTITVETPFTKISSTAITSTSVPKIPLLWRLLHP